MMRPHGFRNALMIGLLLILAGCASAGKMGSATSGYGDLLTAEDMRGFQPLDAYAMIRRLRSFWLNPRGAGSWTTGPNAEGRQVQIRVYIDGVLQPSSVERLKSLMVSEIREIRHVDGREATLRFATDHGAGAIMVTTEG